MDYKGYFSIENVTKYLYLPFFYKNEKKKKFQIFDQNHGLTLLEKCKFSTFLNRCFYRLERLVFNLKLHQYLFSAYFAKNEKKKKFQIFDQNHGPAPLRKCKFCDSLKPMFL